MNFSRHDLTEPFLQLIFWGVGAYVLFSLCSWISGVSIFQTWDLFPSYHSKKESLCYLLELFGILMFFGLWFVAFGLFLPDYQKHCQMRKSGIKRRIFSDIFCVGSPTLRIQAINWHSDFEKLRFFPHILMTSGSNLQVKLVEIDSERAIICAIENLGGREKAFFNFSDIYRFLAGQIIDEFGQKVVFQQDVQILLSLLGGSLSEDEDYGCNTYDRKRLCLILKSSFDDEKGWTLDFFVKNDWEKISGLFLAYL